MDPPEEQETSRPENGLGDRADVTGGISVVAADLPPVEIVVNLAAANVAAVSLLSMVTGGPAALETTNGTRGWKVSCDPSMPTETAFSSRMKCPKIENASSATWPSEQASKSRALSASTSCVMPRSAVAPRDRKSPVRKRSRWSRASEQTPNSPACPHSVNGSRRQPAAPLPVGRRAVCRDHLRPKETNGRLPRNPDRIENAKNEYEALPRA